MTKEQIAAIAVVLLLGAVFFVRLDQISLGTKTTRLNAANIKKNHLHYGPDFVKYILEKNAVIRTGQMRSRDEGNFISGGASHDYHDNA